MSESPSLLILSDGTLIPQSELGSAAMNRAMRLGDGFFETVRVIRGGPHAWEAHHARITACFKALGLEPQPHVDSAFLLRSIYRLIEAHGTQHARVRLTFFRKGGGAYTPETDRPGFIGECMPLAKGDFQVRQEGVHLGLYTALKKYRSPLAPFKLLGNHVYIQAASWAAKHHYDDALICNDAGEIIEATSSNLFTFSEGALHTPPLSSGCVGGVMRMSVLNAAIEAGIPCFETKLSEADILRAEEVWLTNAVQGISWVRSFRDKRFFHKAADRITGLLNVRHAERAEEISAAE